MDRQPGGLQPFADEGVRDADGGGFVEIVDDLAEKAIAVDGEGVEIAFFKQRGNEVSHVILRGFQGEKGWLIVGVLETGLSGDQGPEELDGAAGDTTQGCNGRQAAVGQVWAFHGLVVGEGEGALRDEDEDVLPVNAVCKEGE